MCDSRRLFIRPLVCVLTDNRRIGRQQVFNETKKLSVRTQTTGLQVNDNPSTVPLFRGWTFSNYPKTKASVMAFLKDSVEPR
jgi:hypothetical protein